MSDREDVDDDRDPLDPSASVPSEIPVGLDRRKFIMRSAVVGAATVMVRDRRPRKPLRRRQPHPQRHLLRAATRRPAGRRPECGEEGQRACVDDQDEARWACPSARTRLVDAHHHDFYQRDQTAGRQAGQGDKASGEPVRKPQRDGQGTRHRTSRARDWWKSRQRSTRNSWTACETSRIRCSR